MAISIVFYAPSPEDSALVGAEVYALTRHLNPGEDAGPWHLHGYRPADLAQSLGFASSAELFKEALDGRTLVLHQAAYTWGFIRHEFRLAQRAANRGRRGRGRGRNVKKVQAPEPTLIIDTLATARRQSVECYDSRLRAIVDCYNDPSSALGSAVVAPEGAMPLVGAVASDERRSIDPDTLLEADARLTAALANAQHRIGGCAQIDPEQLVADHFGLQRSSVRVDAANAPRTHVNPGTWEEGKPLVKGMEFVLSPDVASDPDVLIERGVAAGLVYSEKLNRRSSLVVCNTNHELRGKAMHAERKNIPLVDDAKFLELLDDVAPGEKEERPVKPGMGVRPRTSGLPGGNSGGSAGGSAGKSAGSSAGKSAGGSSSGKQGGHRNGGRSGGRHGGKSGSKSGAKSNKGGNSIPGPTSSTNRGDGKDHGKNNVGNRGGRRRRRGGRRGRSQ